MVTRMGLVAKKRHFSAQSGDEKRSRRQKKEFFTSKCRREWISSSKNRFFRLKKTTRTGIVAKKWSFPPQKDDENGSRHQKMEYFASKCRRERVLPIYCFSKVRNSSNKSDTAD
ncbi:hypothetical protein P5F75_07795 [Caldifermentibacillus hisashii]|uniref:hypothetical protein n=1 Tax=Caldifermentibacillus hisashii TaxID=996558 RepID=UPI002E1C3106|nr:hypothetical protein [Caldifermentibacillus hisashii]